MRLVLIFCLRIGAYLNSRHECGRGCLVSGVFPMWCSSELSSVIKVLRKEDCSLQCLDIVVSSANISNPAVASCQIKWLTSTECISREKEGKQARGSFLFGDMRYEQEKCIILLSSYTASWILGPVFFHVYTPLSIKKIAIEFRLHQVTWEPTLSYRVMKLLDSLWICKKLLASQITSAGSR